ncbi:NUDIX domain-containing protein [Streptomyces sp. DSM 44917]|uniref:NUDIX domain-containing protein n=1 Tax=Streptomyces boetiae TaxID=3075541 RepID=A0ABU2LAG0_9ACTN|nr:NUDIX domain-containing protein [Streptomyces sp. DSM 44917]MDT0308486.1 NUDIX domain-containing protein [Streptomyces sp. DSM 44917]
MTNGRQWRLPEDWPVRVRAYVRGELTPVPARRAATVMLLRDGAGGGVEVFLLRRRASMAFAGGMYAYPGGGVDPRDVAAAGEAGAVVGAAVRETFEEAGVLFAGPADGEGLVADVTGPGWEADRAALVARELAFADFLERRGLAVRGGLLALWARWVTPAWDPRRYDTTFFAAVLPDGQRTRNASGEADHAEWLRPADALAGHERGELLMMPPTVATLRELAACATAAGALAAAAGRPAAPVLAEAREEGNGDVVVRWPGYAEFERRLPGAESVARDAGERER